MPSSFTGAPTQRMDGKGRVTIPADYRAVIEEGDPEAVAKGSNPAFYLVYGAHLRGQVKGYTVAEHQRIVAAINSIDPKDDEESEAQFVAQVTMVGSAARVEIDREGRCVLPPVVREKLGMSDGELSFMGLGSSFDLWPATSFAERVTAQVEDIVAAKGPKFNPMAAVWRLRT